MIFKNDFIRISLFLYMHAESCRINITHLKENELCCSFVSVCVSGSCSDDIQVYRADGWSRVFQTVSSGEILPRL